MEFFIYMVATESPGAQKFDENGEELCAINFKIELFRTDEDRSIPTHSKPLLLAYSEVTHSILGNRGTDLEKPLIEIRQTIERLVDQAGFSIVSKENGGFEVVPKTPVEVATTDSV